MAAGRDLGWVSISTAPRTKSLGRDRIYGQEVGAEEGVATAPQEPPGGGRGWILGVFSAVELRGWPSGPCLVGGGVMAVKGVHLWRDGSRLSRAPPVEAGGALQ